MNLFKPYQATCEIYKASVPGEDGVDWQESTVSSVFPWWWGLWIVSNILGNVEMRLAFNDDPDAQIASAWLGVLTSALAIPLALLAITVVSMIHRRQEASATPEQRGGALIQ